jgi:protein-tyrosine phosphatase
MELLTRVRGRELNYSDITPELAVGGSFRTRDVPRLQARGVTAVVDCRREAQDDAAALERAGLAFLHLPAPDGYALTNDQLYAGVDWVLDHLAHGGRAFLHCEHGVGRGPLMGCAVLVAQGRSAPEALHLVRSHRWQAMPNDRQLAALLDFEQGWRQRVSGRSDQPAPPPG